MSNKIASLYELQTIYSYEDAITLYDILLTDSANEQILNDYYNKMIKKNV